MVDGARNNQWVELVGGLLDGELGPDEHRQLAGRLDDPESLRRYCEQVRLHAMLRWTQSAIPPVDERLPNPSDDERASLADDEMQSRWSTSNRMRQLSAFLQRPQGLSLVVALTVIVSAVMTLSLVHLGSTGDDADSTATAEARTPLAEPVARIGRTHDARWSASDLDLRQGSTLRAGRRLELLAGFAEVRLHSGATLLLHGPSTATVRASDTCRLAAGRLSAWAPPGAEGLKIETRAVTVVDLGTEFGVEVDQRQSSLVQVFAGTVELLVDDKDRHKAWRRQLNTGESMRVDVLGRPDTHPRDETPFVRAGEIDRLFAASPPIERLSLWLDAGEGITRDDDGAVEAWTSGVAAATVVAEQEAPRRRPKFVERAIGSHPALRFDGSNDFLNLPAPSKLGMFGSDYEVFVVAQSSHRKTQFLLAGSVENFELHVDTQQVGARFIGRSRFLDGYFSDAGSPGDFTDGRPHVFAARVDRSAGYRAILSVDRGDAAQISLGDARSESDVPLRIGRRNDNGYPLDGDVAEILIYETTLSPRQRSQVYQYLKHKYDLSIR